MKEHSVMSRRGVVAGAALGATAILFGAGTGLQSDSGHEAWASDGEAGAQASESAVGAGQDQQYGFLMRVDHCVDCGECVTACRHYSKTEEGVASRRRIESYVTQDGKTVTISTSCMHCEKPSCLEVCPAAAISKGAGGIVTVDLDRCIGCKYCHQACPYGVPHYSSAGMDKCDYCLGAGVALGERTHCVQACHVDALLCGPVSELLEKYPDAVRIQGTPGASCYLDAGKTR